MVAYVFYISHYNSEGTDMYGLMSKILDTFTFGPAPTETQLRVAVGSCLRKNIDKFIIRRLMDCMLYHHQNYIGWGSDRSLHHIESILYKNNINKKLMMQKDFETYNDDFKLDIKNAIGQMTDENIYDWFFGMVGNMNDAHLKIEKIDY